MNIREVGESFKGTFNTAPQKQTEIPSSGGRASLNNTLFLRLRQMEQREIKHTAEWKRVG